MVFHDKKRAALLNKQLHAIERQEAKLKEAAFNTKASGLKYGLEAKIPAKVYMGLESAFCKGFSLVFSQGRSVIEKSYKRESIKADHEVRDFALQKKGGRKEYRSIKKSAGHASAINLTLTSVEGIALGALGIGMPDVVLFLSTLFKGVFETALNYGFDYVSKSEQYLILKMMQTALSTGESWEALNCQVDVLFSSDAIELSDKEFKDQLNLTAASFAADMLLLKFVQGLPIIGVIGGAANPIYYNKIMKYINLKYRKHYLLKLKNKT